MSFVQIRVKNNVLTSYLYGYATLGPVKVFMDTGRCSSIVHSRLSCLFVDENFGCCPDYFLLRILLLIHFIVLSESMTM